MVVSWSLESTVNGCHRVSKSDMAETGGGRIVEGRFEQGRYRRYHSGDGVLCASQWIVGANPGCHWNEVSPATGSCSDATGCETMVFHLPMMCH